MDNSAVAPWHFGLKYAGHTYEWLPTDTEENFQRLMQDPNHREYFHSKGWDQPAAITYKINSHGFRSEEFDPAASSLVSLGCSYTVGIGLPEHATWPHLVAQAAGLKNYNLAWGGTSADTCFMQAQHWLPVLRPQLVVMAAPPKARFDLISEDPARPHNTYLPSDELLHTSSADNDTFVKTWFLHDRNAELNNARNRLAVQALCAGLGITCLTYNAHDWFAKSREQLEYARDHMHAGPRGHRLLAERIIHDWHETKTA
jgi:hypothetical protein